MYYQHLDSLKDIISLSPTPRFLNIYWKKVKEIIPPYVIALKVYEEIAPFLYWRLSDKLKGRNKFSQGLKSMLLPVGMVTHSGNYL